MDGCAAELLLCDGLAGYGLDNLGACHEHVAGALAHDYEVGEGGRVYRTAGAWAEDGGYLRHYARCEDVALEYLRIAGKAVDTLLYAGAARVVDADEGCAVLHCHIHHLAYFGCEGFGE